MNRWMKAAAVVAGGAAAGAAAMALGDALWNRSTAKRTARIRRAGREAPKASFSLLELARLPAPVQQYFAFALQPDQPLIRSARLVQSGEFRAGGLDSKWSPFTAVQEFSGRAPGFVWDARIQIAPLVTVRVRDSYIGGVGAMQGKMGSLIPIMDRSGERELAMGALHRYLAEAVWLPTALLPGQGVTWEPIDESSARATLTDDGLTVSLDFRFGERGEIVSCYAAERYRDVNGLSVPTPWACYYGDYAQAEGMMIPLQGEAEWILREGWLSYCRLDVQSIKYDRALSARQSGTMRR